MISGTVTLSARVSGSAASAGAIKATVRARQSIRGLITPGDIVIGDLPYYTGEYTVTPSLDAQILDTQGKAMRDDVVVQRIPIIFTTNPQGGQSVVIG